MDHLKKLRDEVERLVASVNPDDAYRKFEVACQSGFVPAQQELGRQIAIKTRLRRLLELCRNHGDCLERSAEEGYTICCSDLGNHIKHHTSVPEYRRLQQKCFDALEIQKKVTTEIVPRVDELYVKSVKSEEELRKMLAINEDFMTGRKQHGIYDHITEQAERRVRLCRQALQELL